ncbi:biorientation of chromosomes in cell division protein 1-like 1 [Oppia nitens]|uniref:biorientation of chromosomes in cell division protein 1-like 1 n=1 Tax=Oppia nitens TaxID=1686743 RepID=UPI0023DA2D65|nr:biorientation of chromosomes in cell division protein 1-like 1 [Oppia nitens]
MSQSSHSSSCDSLLINTIVDTIKSRGIFDELRRECLSDADTKPSFQNLLQRVEGYVSKFLSQQKWSQSLNKNQLRERLRRQLNESGMLKYGIEHLVEQVVNFKINSFFWPKIESVVKEFLGIQDETPVPAFNGDYPSNKLSKSNSKSELNDLKIDVKSQLETIVKVEPQDIPMDTETDSNSSTDNNIKVKEENDIHSDNAYNDWSTPPIHETFRPLAYSPIDNSIKLNTDLITGNKNNENVLTKDLNDSEVNNELFNEQSNQSSETNHMIVEKKVEKVKQKDIKSDLSDVSSVHTSDLSDFDDEISLDGSNDELSDNKKKISLKVAKQITEVLSNEQPLSDKNNKCDNKTIIGKQLSDNNIYQTNVNNESKRVRKINPKYSSKEFSSIFTEKDITIASTSRDESNQMNDTFNNIKSDNEHRFSSRRKRHYNSDSNDKDVYDLYSHRNSKIIKRNEDSRCSSRESVESSLSETTQDSNQSRINTRRSRRNRNELQSQSKRYDTTDLYKPRSQISSRRRPHMTPESSTQSNDDFFIHDLSK